MIWDTMVWTACANSHCSSYSTPSVNGHPYRGLTLLPPHLLRVLTLKKSRMLDGFHRITVDNLWSYPWLPLQLTVGTFILLSRNQFFHHILFSFHPSFIDFVPFPMGFWYLNLLSQSFGMSKYIFFRYCIWWFWLSRFWTCHIFRKVYKGSQRQTFYSVLSLIFTLFPSGIKTQVFELVLEEVRAPNGDIKYIR
jgi:hypothetical protein